MVHASYQPCRAHVRSPIKCQTVTLLQLDQAEFILMHSACYKIGTILESVPSRSVIIIHWVGLWRTLTSVQMSSNKAIVYILLFWAREEQNSGGNIWGNARCCQKLARGTFSYLLLKPPLVGYPVVLVEQALWASLKPCQTVSAPNTLIQTKSVWAIPLIYHHRLILQFTEESRPNKKQKHFYNLHSIAIRDFPCQNKSMSFLEWGVNVWVKKCKCHTSVAFLKYHRESFLLIKMAIDPFTLFTCCGQANQ